uniref:Auxin-responsive protein n=2 Tax=Kalanchoe fedtschenkoi TaxID=63787 RepID=A0A7N0TT91_KALFE
MMTDGSDPLEITELRLGQPGADNGLPVKKLKKRDFADMSGSDDRISTNNFKSEVVGWPPVCSYRRKNVVGDGSKATEASKMYVKVSMDGVPFLRKIDLNSHCGYSDLITGFHKLFSCEKMSINEGDGSEYVPIYEDKDGDWMLVGDVPWQMFVESCKRLRIMKKSEAKGIEPSCLKRTSTTGSSKDE